MPDETLKLQDQLKKEAGEVYQFISKPVYNIDDMDDRAFMRDHRMEGVYVLGCKAMVDVDRPGRVYVNGADAGEPIVSWRMQLGVKGAALYPGLRSELHGTL